MHTPTTSRPHALLLLVLLMSLAGCAPLSPQQTPPACIPVQPAQIPPPPADLMTPPASGNFSERAAADMQMWRQQLTPYVSR